MAAKCEMSCIIVETSKSFAKNKYDCQTWNTKGIIDMKEQIWLMHMKVSHSV